MPEKPSYNDLIAGMANYTNDNKIRMKIIGLARGELINGITNLDKFTDSLSMWLYCSQLLKNPLIDNNE